MTPVVLKHANQIKLKTRTWICLLILTTPSSAALLPLCKHCPTYSQRLQFVMQQRFRVPNTQSPRQAELLYWHNAFRPVKLTTEPLQAPYLLFMMVIIKSKF